MKIEFRKVPQSPKNFTTEFNSVKIEGTFCKMSPSLVKINSTLTGKITVDCARCGQNSDISLDEDFNFLISDGIYKSESDDLVIEIENGVIDFDEIIQSEISSIFSDYHICSNCEHNDFLEQEF